jgi:PIN domain nuclease of toxin-antitoxin system
LKLLLDTHVFLWWRLNASRLKTPARKAIATADIVWISAASGWEAAIKQQLGRLSVKDPFPQMVEASDFRELPVMLRHTEQLSVLPQHHADPFDRMLVSQAIVEKATLVTHDRQIEPYDVSILWV